MGAVVGEGERLGVPVPVSRACDALLGLLDPRPPLGPSRPLAYTDPVRNSYTLGPGRRHRDRVQLERPGAAGADHVDARTGVFPDTNPGLGDNTYFAMAVVAAFGFFASILLHELGTRSRRAATGWRSTASPCGCSAASRASPACSPPRAPSSGSRSPGRSCRWLLAGGLLGGTWLPGLPEPVDGVLAWLGVINAAPPDLQPDPRPAARRRADAARGALAVEGRPAVGHPAGRGHGRVLAIGMIGLGHGDRRARRRDQRRVARPDRLVRAPGRRRRGADGACSAAGGRRGWAT